ncbi:unnamed protein product [Symbiodinium microadriaticum]|nr:unnamed protein product [Symbiodinium microadriaticum]CAE7253368.1 unnamed protein product [Symbiodinium sp. KB8]
MCCKDSRSELYVCYLRKDKYSQSDLDAWHSILEDLLAQQRMLKPEPLDGFIMERTNPRFFALMAQWKAGTGTGG